MYYRYLEDIATADMAFEAGGGTLNDTFMACSEALLAEMVEDPEQVRPLRTVDFTCEADSLDMLLFEFLEELIFRKDAERLFLRVTSVSVEKHAALYRATVHAAGEEIDPGRHSLGADIKAVTMHRLAVEHTDNGWRATVVCDV